MCNKGIFQLDGSLMKFFVHPCKQNLKGTHFFFNINHANINLNNIEQVIVIRVYLGELKQGQKFRQI